MGKKRKTGLLVAAVSLVLGLESLACDALFQADQGSEYGDSSDMGELINQYRTDRGLEEIPISPSLTLVAQRHVEDLERNHPDTGKCNLHSWSAEGSWTACCYTDDHAKAQCMWDKPRELTDYVGDGYEISANYSGQMTAGTALEQWRGSPGHNNVILNQDIWADNEWRAVGGALSKHYAVVWFGEAIEPDSP